MARSKVAQGQTRSETSTTEPPASAERSTAAGQTAAEKPWEEQEAERAKLGNVTIPITLGKLCRVIGPDVKPERFGTTALMSLAVQLEGIESIAQMENTGLYDRWCCVENIVARMRLAANVSEWLEQGQPAEMPEVEP